MHLLPQETRADGLVSQAPAPTPSRISDPGMRLSVVPHGKSLYFEAGLPLNFAQSRFQGSVRLVPRVGAYALEQLPALERALIELDEAPALKQLHDQLEAVQRLASKLKLALSEQNRIAELRIRAAQKAGSILAQSVKRGGNSHGGSSAPLPDGISWNQSSSVARTCSDRIALAAFLHRPCERGTAGSNGCRISSRRLSHQPGCSLFE